LRPATAQLTAIRSVAYQNGQGFAGEAGNIVISQSTAIENGIGIYVVAATGRIMGKAISRNTNGVYVDAMGSLRSKGGNMIDGNRSGDVFGTITPVSSQ
jgi:hypothetical protein